MKFLLALVLSSLSAHAIIIEDSPERLIFDLTWSPPHHMWGIPLHFDNGTSGETSYAGTEFMILRWGGNPYSFMVEIHPPDRSLWWNFMVTFQGWAMEMPSHPPDPVWGTDTAPWIGREIPADHLFAVAGNDHAVRVVVGALPVPEGGDTMVFLLLALSALALRKTMR